MMNDFFYEIRIIWNMTVSSGLGMGRRMFIASIIFISLILNVTAIMALNDLLQEAPIPIRFQVFSEFMKHYLFYMSLSLAFYTSWILSFQLFAVEKEEKILETLLSLPLRIASIYLGKIVAFISLFVPTYLFMSLNSLPLLLKVSEHVLKFLPSIEVPFVCWIMTLFVAPIFGIGVCCLLSLIQLLSKNPRTPSFILLMIGLAYSVGVNIFKDYLQISIAAAIVLALISIIVLMLPVMIIIKGYITNESVILPG